MAQLRGGGRDIWQPNGAPVPFCIYVADCFQVDGLPKVTGFTFKEIFPKPECKFSDFEHYCKGTFPEGPLPKVKHIQPQFLIPFSSQNYSIKWFNMNNFKV